VPVMTCKFDRVVTPDGFVVLQLRPELVTADHDLVNVGENSC